MNTADISIFFAFIFGLASASPVSLSSTVASSRRPGNWVSPAHVARSDDDHLCYAPTDVVFEYGNQTNQDEIVLDCEKLSQKFKAVTDEQGNITESCGDPVPSKRHAGFKLLGSEGNCSFWSQCHGTDTTNEVTFDYGDIADVIKLATDGLKSSGLSKNSSILSVNASTQCQTLQTDWVVAFNSSESGVGSQEGGPARPLWTIASDFSPAEGLHQ